MLDQRCIVASSYKHLCIQNALSLSFLKCGMTSLCFFSFLFQLDKQNRAKITDLGFCKPEAMMSGSIVGTPIHMAPELFTGTLIPSWLLDQTPPLCVNSSVFLFFFLMFLFHCHCFLTGKYDNSVDVYAFGILFWYLCTGSVKLPEAFEKCSSKDQLWNNVKKGDETPTDQFVLSHCVLVAFMYTLTFYRHHPKTVTMTMYKMKRLKCFVHDG